VSEDEAAVDVAVIGAGPAGLYAADMVHEAVFLSP